MKQMLRVVRTRSHVTLVVMALVALAGVTGIEAQITRSTGGTVRDCLIITIIDLDSMKITVGYYGADQEKSRLAHIIPSGTYRVASDTSVYWDGNKKLGQRGKPWLEKLKVGDLVVPVLKEADMFAQIDVVGHADRTYKPPKRGKNPR